MSYECSKEKLIIYRTTITSTMLSYWHSTYSTLQHLKALVRKRAPNTPKESHLVALLILWHFLSKLTLLAPVIKGHLTSLVLYNIVLSQMVVYLEHILCLHLCRGVGSILHLLTMCEEVV